MIFTPAHCPHNVTSLDNQTYFEHETETEIKKIYLHYHGYVIGSLALMAIFCSLIFMATTYRAIRLQKGSRKYYVLLLNRGSGDFIGASTSTISAILAIHAPNANHQIGTLVGCFFYATFWSAYVSYISLSAIKLYAVWRPFSYRKSFTFRKCLYIIGLSYIIFGVCGTVCICAVTHMHIHWIAELHGLRYLLTGFFCLAFIFTILIFILTVIVLKKIERDTMFGAQSESRTSKGGQSQGTQFPLWKLALGVSTFAFFQTPHIAWNFYLLISIGCLYRSAESLGTQAFIGGAVLLRIVTDFFVVFVTDLQLRKVLLDDCLRVFRICFCCSPSQTHSSTTSPPRSSSEPAKRRSTQSSV